MIDMGEHSVVVALQADNRMLPVNKYGVLFCGVGFSDNIHVSFYDAVCLFCLTPDGLSQIAVGIDGQLAWDEFGFFYLKRKFQRGLRKIIVQSFDRSLGLC